MKLSQLITGPRFIPGQSTVIKLALFDVDNTLVGNNSADLPSERFIAAAKESGKIIPIGLATARALLKVQHILDACDFHGYSILSNGAQIYDGATKTMLVELTVPLQDSLTLCQLLRKRAVRHWVADDGIDKFWTPELGDAHYASAKNVWLPLSDDNREDFSNYQPVKPLVIVASEVPESDKDAVLGLAHGLSSDVTAMVAHETVLKDGAKTYEVFFLHKHANKHDALLKLSELSHIDLGSVMAVGDGPNDTVIVENVGLGVAVANAVEQTMAAATFIAPAQSADGAAIALEELVLS